MASTTTLGCCIGIPLAVTMTTAAAAPQIRQPTEKVLVSFGTGDGVDPLGAPVRIGDSLYGVTFIGGSSNNGTIYQLSADGALTTVHDFTGGEDGAHPNPLTQGSDGCLYGSTEDSTLPSTFGTLFRFCPSGTFTTLFQFQGSSGGISPAGGLTESSDGTLYGVTSYGGAGYGTIFSLAPNGAYSTLYSFSGHGDGGYPYARLTFGNDGALYGITDIGGDNDGGTVFRATTSGELTTLHSLDYQNYAYVIGSALTLGSDGRFYGTTLQSGSKGLGEIFSISPSGDYKLLYTFTGGAEGQQPLGTLVEGLNGNFFGVAQGGGSDLGHVFRISPDGDLKTLYVFQGGSDGAVPCSGLMRTPLGTLYGTTCSGGASGSGTIYRLSLFP